MNAFGIPERPVDYESSGDILFVNRNENLADPRGTRRLDDIENAIACARLGPLKDRIRVVDWSEYSIIEQLEMTYNAAAIISIHGAALSNTLWMRPGSQIIELIPYKVFSPTSLALKWESSVPVCWFNLCRTISFGAEWLWTQFLASDILRCCSSADAAIFREPCFKAWR